MKFLKCFLVINILTFFLSGCTNEMEGNACNHSWYEMEIETATCVEDGYIIYGCDYCTETIVEILDSTGHKVAINSAVSSTCTETGLTEGSYCLECDQVLVEQEIIPTIAHNIVVDEALAPTCTETGLTEGSHCNVCNEILIGQEVIPAFSHNVVVDDAVAPTCTETGLTEGSHCNVCNEILIGQEVIPALSHNVVVDDAVAPTCNTTGLTEGSHCFTCGTVLMEQEIIEFDFEKHDYQDYVCSRCDFNYYTLGLIFTLSASRTGYNVTGYTGDECDIIIPAKYNDLPVEVIGNNCFKNKTYIENVYILAEITKIGSNAFEGCSALVNIELPSSIASIGTNAFLSCDSLTYYTYDNACYLGNSDNHFAYLVSVLNINIESCTIHENTLMICNSAFSDCTLLAEVELSEGLKYICDSAFYKCTSLTNIAIPNSVIGIGSYAFYKCSSLENLSIPFAGAELNSETNSHFGYIFGAWDYNSNYSYVPSSLTDVTINGDSIIFDYAFSGCRNIVNLTIGTNNKQINFGAFNDCSSLETLIIPTLDWLGYYFGASSYDSTNNYVPASLENVIITRATTLKNKAFSGCKNIESITLPNTLKSVGSYAFENCVSLKTLVIPESVTSVSNVAFYGCYYLETLFLPYINKALGFYFGYFDAPNDYGYSHINQFVPQYLKEVIITGGSSLPSNAFYQCRKIEKISLPATMSSVGTNAFSFCDNLICIEIDSDNPYFDSRNNCNAIIKTSTNTLITGCRTTVIPDSITSISNYAFEDVSIPTVVIPEGVASIGKYAFKGSYLNSVTLPNTLKTIGEYAFANCYFTSLDLPSSVESIGVGALYGCTKLKDLTIPFVGGQKNSATSYFVYLFEYDGKYNYSINPIIENLVILGGNIDNNAFKDSYVDNVTLCDDVQRIETRAFFGSKRHYGVLTIGAGVYYIGPDAIHGFVGIEVDPENQIYDSRDNCNAVIETASNTLTQSSKNTVIPSSVIRIGELAFAWKSITSIDIPEGVIEICDEAFYRCEYLKDVTIPDSLKIIGANAFQYCMKLGYDSEYIYLDNQAWVKFVGSSNSTIIYFGENVTVISEDVFGKDFGRLYTTGYDNALYFGTESNPYYMLFRAVSKDITSCQVHPDTKYINQGAFERCENLTSITLPEGLLSIGIEAFRSCYNLEEVQFPSTLLKIGSFSFGNCTSLEKIVIPKSVISIGQGAFMGCYWLDNIQVEEGNIIYDSREECNAIIYTATNTIIAGCDTTDILEDITAIGDYAFYYQTGLRELTIPGNVTYIGYRAFDSCSNIIKLVLSEGVYKLGESAFFGGYDLVDIYIPESLRIIGESAFKKYLVGYENIYYYGTEEQWNTIKMGSNNEVFLETTITFEYEPPKVRPFVFNYYNSEEWANVYAYVWKDNTPLVGWPGQLMTKCDDGWYTYQIDELTLTGYKIIFNNGSSSQTKDINLNDTNLYYYGTTGVGFTSKEEVLDALVNYAPKCSVIGLGFDGAGSWDTDLFMDMTSPNFYEAKIVVSSSAQFKIRINSSWDENYGGTLNNGSLTGTLNGANIKISSAGTYKITFDYNTKKITVTKQ